MGFNPEDLDVRFVIKNIHYSRNGVEMDICNIVVNLVF